MPVADRRPPLAAPDPAPRPGRPARRRAGRSPGEEADRVVIEQSELDAAVAAIRDGVRRPASPAEEHGPARLIKRLEEVLDVPRDQWPPSALRAFWEPLRDLAEQRFKGPRHESRWFNLAGFCLRPGHGLPARRG